MSDQYRVPFRCPHCGHENIRLFGRYDRRDVVTCNLDEGGCDQDFVVEPNIAVTVNPVVYRIEGIGKPVERPDDEEDRS